MRGHDVTVVVRIVAALTLPVMAWAERPSVPRAPNLLALERNGNAAAVLGFGMLESRTVTEFAVEGEMEALDDIYVGLIVPVAMLGDDGGGQTVYDDDGILLCADDNCRGEPAGTSLGNIGLTARALWPRGESDGPWVLGAGLGLWLPTSGADSGYAAGLGLATHPLDPGRFAADRCTIRPSGSVGYEGRRLLAQVELGLDIAIGVGDEDDGSRPRFPVTNVDTSGNGETLLLTAAAIGVVARPVALYTEIGALHDIAQSEDVSRSQSRTTLAFGLRSYRTRIVLGLALVLPVNDAAKNTIDAGVRLTGGARF